MKVTAKVTRSGDWWAIEVPEVPGVFTQAKRLDQVEPMVQDAVALMTDTEPDAIEVSVVPVLPDAIESDVRRARQLSAELARLQEEASMVTREVVVQLRDVEHLSVRDVGRILAVSPQRVSQLAAVKSVKPSKGTSKSSSRKVTRVPKSGSVRIKGTTRSENATD